MEISSIQSITADTASAMQKESKTASSFEGYFLTASDSSDDAVSGDAASEDASDDTAVQEFMNYAKETPAQRMFNDWLSSQNITEQQYAAMTPAQQQKLVEKFEAQMKQELSGEANTLLALSVAS